MANEIKPGTRIRFLSDPIGVYGYLTRGQEGTVYPNGPLANTFGATDEFTVRFAGDASEGWFFRLSEEGTVWELVD